jgi:uncharacterized membrane protein
MLLLINHRYPALGTVLSFISAAAFVAMGAEWSNRMMIVMGAVSLVIGIARFSRRTRTAKADA